MTYTNVTDQYTMFQDVATTLKTNDNVAVDIVKNQRGKKRKYSDINL